MGGAFSEAEFDISGELSRRGEPLDAEIVNLDVYSELDTDLGVELEGALTFPLKARRRSRLERANERASKRKYISKTFVRSFRVYASA